MYLQHGYSEVDRIAVSIPAGYRLEAMPAKAEVKTPFAAFQATRISEGGVVRLERHAEINGYYFPVKSYGSVRDYFEKLRQSDAEPWSSTRWNQRTLIRITPFALLLALAFSSTLVCAGTPDWLKQIAQGPLPAYPDDTDAVVLLDERLTTITPAVKFVPRIERCTRFSGPGGELGGFCLSILTAKRSLPS